MSSSPRRAARAALAFFACLAGCRAAVAQESAAAPAQYLFSYFVGNGEDGLHLAHSTDGYRWQTLNGGKSLLTPTAGGDKLMRDPSIAQGPDGTFHMVWTVSWGERGIGYSWSKDLIEWAPQRFVPVMEHEPTALNCWAPELYYDEATETFLIFWATTIPGRFPDTDGQDGRYNHRMYLATTRDFQDFTPTRLFYDHGFNVIDAAIAKSGERYVMVLKDETNRPLPVQKNIRVALADEAAGPYGPPSEPITGDYWAEGPTLLRVGAQWRVYFDKYRKHQFGVVASENLADWTDDSERLQMPSGARHGTAFAAPSDVIERLLQLP